MDNDESDHKFDGLVSADEVSLESHLLTRVPGLRNMRQLKYACAQIHTHAAMFVNP